MTHHRHRKRKDDTRKVQRLQHLDVTFFNYIQYMVFLSLVGIDKKHLQHINGKRCEMATHRKHILTTSTIIKTFICLQQVSYQIMNIL